MSERALQAVRVGSNMYGGASPEGLQMNGLPAEQADGGVDEPMVSRDCSILSWSGEQRLVRAPSASQLKFSSSSQPARITPTSYHSGPIQPFFVPRFPQHKQGSMLSVRTLARSAPRAVSRMAAASSLRAPAAARAGTLARSSSATLSALRPSRATFSTTVGRRAADGEVDDELSAKLESEIQIEGGMADNEQLPTSVKDFLENSPFELEDTPGTEVVKLTRAFGDEKCGPHLPAVYAQGSD